jgi:hypothetical protein
MTYSKQSIKVSSASERVLQQSDAASADQSISGVQARSIEQIVNSNNIDLDMLAEQLAILRPAMRQAASSAEQDLATGQVAAAEAEAKNGNEAQAMLRLKSAGKWALDIAEKVGVGLAVAVIKQAMQS